MNSADPVDDMPPGYYIYSHFILLKYLSPLRMGKRSCITICSLREYNLNMFIHFLK